MVPTPRILILLPALSLAFFSCKKGGDSLDRLLGDRAKGGTGDQALTLLKENESVGGAKGDGYGVITRTNRSAVMMDEGEPNLVSNAAVSRPKGPSVPVAPVKYASDSDIRKWIANHQYEKVLAAKIDPKNASQVYYSGNANFVSAMMAKGVAREKFVATAEKQFAAAGKLETDKTRKARAYLWLGITRYKYRSGTYDLETVSQPLRYVVEKMADTPYYNDALLYLGLARTKFNLRDSAKDYFNLLARTDARDRVYDIDYQKWSTPQAAARHYLNLIGEPNRDPADDPRVGPAPVPRADVSNTSPDRPSPVYRPQGADSTRDAFLEKVERIHREILGAPIENRSNAAPGSGSANPAPSENPVTANAGDAADAEIVTPRK